MLSMMNLNIDTFIDDLLKGDQKAEKEAHEIYQKQKTPIVKIMFEKLKSPTFEGHQRAQFHLGCLYERGDDDQPPNYKDAFKYYQLSADQGDSDAQCHMGHLY